MLKLCVITNASLFSFIKEKKKKKQMASKGKQALHYSSPQIQPGATRSWFQQIIWVQQNFCLPFSPTVKSLTVFFWQNIKSRSLIPMGHKLWLSLEALWALGKREIRAEHFWIYVPVIRSFLCVIQKKRSGWFYYSLQLKFRKPTLSVNKIALLSFIL